MSTPDPAERFIVLFDGTCNLCNGSVRFIKRHDSKGKFMFLASQTPEGTALARKFGFTGPTPGSIVLVIGDRAFSRSTASLEIARRLDGLWPALYAFVLIPRFVRDGVYGFIAKNRHKWFGRADQCEVVQSEHPIDRARK